MKNYQMSNEELATAIQTAHDKHYNCMANTDKEKLWLIHLDALLEIQKTRAEATQPEKVK